MDPGIGGCKDFKKMEGSPVGCPKWKNAWSRIRQHKRVCWLNTLILKKTSGAQSYKFSGKNKSLKNVSPVLQICLYTHLEDHLGNNSITYSIPEQEGSTVHVRGLRGPLGGHPWCRLCVWGKLPPLNQVIFEWRRNWLQCTTSKWYKSKQISHPWKKGEWYSQSLKYIDVLQFKYYKKPYFMGENSAMA